MTVGAAAARGAVVVTGASTGIGEACALGLDGLGVRVFAGVRKAADGDALTRKASGRLTPVLLDVTDAAAIAAAAETVAKAVGEAGLAGLVNNAGISVAGPLEFLPIAELRAQLEVNVIGQVAVTQAFLPMLRKARGRIVNMGSIAGRSATPFVGAYCASKFALEALTDALRMELGPWGIAVSIVEPGAVATPIWEKSVARASATMARRPPQARDFYGQALTTMREASERMARGAIPTDRVVAAVVHALTAARPKTRYLVGADAKVQVALKILPDRLRDRLIVRALRLPQEA